MDTTPKSAAEIFSDQLTALELLFAIELPGRTPGDRLNSLREKALGNPALTESLKSFLDNPLNFSAKFSSLGNTFEAIVRTLFATAARGAIHDYGSGGAPKNQHWMPVAYLKPFGSATGSSKNNRSVRVQGVSFADKLIMGFEIRDSNFIHDQVKGAGFYEDSAEFFFCLIENLYSQGRTRQERPIDNCLVALFFFVQSVRNPRGGKRFIHSRLCDIVDAVLANIDAVGPGLQTEFLKTADKMPFTPYVPPFVDRFKGARIYSLPIEPKTLFCISTKELSEGGWRQIPARYRKAVIIQAYRRGSHIFGVHKDGILGLLQKLGLRD